MNIPLSQITLPVLLRGLESLDRILHKSQAHAVKAGENADSLAQARLAPDMYPLAGQVQAASDAAKACAGRLSGQDIPAFADTETTFEALFARIEKTRQFILAISPEQVDQHCGATIVLNMPNGEVSFTKRDYLFKLALPNFYFHLVAAYAILRHQGIALGKADYLGNLSEP